MAWVYVFIGGLLDVGWAIGLQQSEGFTRLWPSIVTIVLLLCSFYFFAKSMATLEVGTAYAVFTGLGTAGTAIVGLLFLGEPADWQRLLFLALLIGGVIGLKMISSEGKEGGKTERQAASNPAGGGD